MKFSTKHHSGMVELLIIVPLFLGMICVIAWIGFLLVAKTKMEKHAWVIQTKQTYDMEVNPKQLNSQYEIDSDISIRQFLQIGTTFRGNLPTAFQRFLRSKITKYKTLKWNGQSPDVIQYSYNAAFETSVGNQNRQQPIPNILPYSFDADLIVADTGMAGLEIVKQKMQDEALVLAGFGEGYKFRELGFKELKDARVPFARIAELVANWDLPGDYLDEVKRWID
jgi:hypothetical protein